MNGQEDTDALARQARRLETACTIIHSVHTSLSLDRMVEGIVENLVEVGGFAGAEITLEATFDDFYLKHAARAGALEDAALVRRVGVFIRGTEIGTLATCAPSAGVADDLAELLEFVLPTLLMGIEHAVSYAEVLDYRRSLEVKVAERTAQLSEATAQLAQSLEDVREAKAARDRFFANINHELRTPLSIITFAAGAIEMRIGAALDGQARSSLGVIHDASRKLLRLVDELLLLAAGQESKLRLHTEPTDLVALVAQLEVAWRPAAEAAGLALAAAAPPSLIANVDPTAIERVATNLISNAVKYTPRGGRVDLDLSLTPGIRLSVLDTGPGISPELAGRLFERYERGEEQHDKAGTGIGLALVKQLVEGHGGTVSFHARPAGGSELRVELPAHLVTDARPRRRESSPEPTQRRPATAAHKTVLEPPAYSQGTIVVAEDDVTLAGMVGRMLAAHYTVAIVHDGTSALAAVEEHQPQLLITDVDMPGMDGIELARRFRKLTGDRLAPVIILSAVVDLATRVAGLEAGAIDYVTKPFDPLELEHRVRAQFRMRDLAVRLHRAEQLTSLGVLTAGLAHELRNPANGIINALQPLRERLPREAHADPAVCALMEVVDECAKQIAFLSSQLLGFRQEAQPALRPAPLRDLLKRAITLSARSLEEVDVRVDLADDLTIACAPPLLVQAFTNLIENAAQAAGAGGWIRIAAARAHGMITIEVADSGPGVPLDLRERIFEPFFTTKAPGSGTGLGLPIARDVVQRHRGVLEVRARDAKAVFVVELPEIS
ncbi:MAG: response regulator [Deltaproteobacteria bacterium]|nr:response regulator [Deltaproteobacteria bacterium]MCW5801733.1 response regulator [Deltaproteobacteria bacterium]